MIALFALLYSVVFRENRGKRGFRYDTIMRLLTLDIVIEVSSLLAHAIW